MAEQLTIPAEEVHAVLGKHLLTDGFKLVLDTDASQGSWLVDARDGKRYLDMYTFFASAPLGCNPPGLVDDIAFMDLLGRVAANKPANPDIYSVHLAEFTETFVRVLGDPRLPHLSFSAFSTASAPPSTKNRCGSRGSPRTRTNVSVNSARCTE